MPFCMSLEFAHATNNHILQQTPEGILVGSQRNEMSTKCVVAPNASIALLCDLFAAL